MRECNLVNPLFSSRFQSNILKVVCSLFLFYNIHYAHDKITERYLSYSWMNNLGNKTELWAVKKDLASLGVDKNDKVISIPDPSPNHTLYTINRNGWTDLYKNVSSLDQIRELIKLGAKYLIVNDTTIFQNRIYLKEFSRDIIYDKNGVQIFDLSSFK